MKTKRDRARIAGVLVVACLLAFACFIGLQGNSKEAAPHSFTHTPQEAALSDNGVEEGADDGVVVQTPYEDTQVESYEGYEYEPNIVLVTLPIGITPADAVSTIIEETGITDIALANEADLTASAPTGAEAPRFVEISIPNDIAVEEAVSRISASSAVDAVQPNFIYHLNDDTDDDSEERAQNWLIAQRLSAQDLITQATTVNDTDIDKQWALKSIYAYGDTTGVGNAWDVVTDEKKVTVAVIDEGFEVNHPDLAGNIVEAYNCANKSSDVSEMAGENGHGTHVAGIVSAVANNGLGVAGVSHNARMLLIKGADTSGGFTSSSLAASVNYARQKKSAYNIRVINISVGGGMSSTSDWSDDVLIKAIDDATNAGIVVVGSAGNRVSGSWIPPFLNYPSDYKNVIGVINLMQADGTDPHNVTRNPSSNYNVNASDATGKSISAPGSSIYSTYPGSDYRYLSGTSMAAPCVSGVLALMFTANPNLTAAQATSVLYSTATDIGNSGWDVETGYGEVNAYRAVANINSFISGPTSVQVGKSITLTTTASATTWQSSDTSVATVSNGTVTGVSGGTAHISARVGTTTLHQDVTVYDPTISGASSADVGSTLKLSLTGKSITGSWNWKTSNANVATVSSSGLVTAKSAGTVTITATLSGNSNVSASKTISIKQKKTDGGSSDAVIPPSWSGATRVPVGAIARYSVTNGSIAIKSGGAYATLSKNTLTGKAAGTVVLSLRDSKGTERATKSVTIYKLSGSCTVKSAINTSKVLDIAGGSLRNGGNLQIWNSNGSAAQKYSFTLQSDGYFRITCTHNGKALDVSGGSTSNGANVQQYAWNSSNAQRWRIEVDASNRLTFVNKGSGKALDVAGARNANGANVQQYASNGKSAQKWTLSATTCSLGPILDGVYRVTTSLNRSYALDVSGASRSNGANVQVWQSNGTSAQQWSFEYQGNGYYKVTCAASGKALDISGASKSNGANAQQWNWNGTGAQLWKVRRNTDGTFTLTCKASGKVLDVSGGLASNGRNVWQYALNGTRAQKWLLYQY